MSTAYYFGILRPCLSAEITVSSLAAVKQSLERIIFEKSIVTSI